MVGEQVDLVHVQDALVGAREDARLERLLARERAAQVERADQPVEGRAERQLDERRRAQLAGPLAARTGGNSGASARTAVDFAVPRSPRTRTPPTSGETALISNACTSCCWPTIALSGNCPATVMRPRLPASSVSRSPNGRPGSRARLL
jgi:hypothetical protein